MDVIHGLPAPPVGAGETDPGHDVPKEGGVLLPLSDGDVSRQALELARTIAIGSDSELIVLNAVCLPEQTPLDHSPLFHDDQYESISSVLESVEDASPDLPTKGAVHVGRDRLRILSKAVERYDARVVVVDDSWQYSRLAPVARTPFEKLSSSVDCAVVMATSGQLPGAITSVLVPVSGGPHSRTATQTARAIADYHDAWIELLHVITSSEPSDRQSGEKVLDANVSRLGEFDSFDRWLLEAESVEGAIIDQSGYYDVTIIGAPRTPRLKRFVFGSKSRTIQKEGPNNVVTVWS